MTYAAAQTLANEVHPRPFAEPLTLLELVATVAEFAETDEEVVATVSHLINSRAVTLVGNFRNSHVRVG